ncbi:MAG TPA: glycosyltransferase family 4 protein, partial [Acidobacteriota bacterium]|nr:glycosyltransferase family 4 protein [Acidobacteriota bacterium]
MRLTYFARYSRVGPSSRYRIFQFENRYREAGVDLQVQILFDDRYFEILRSSFPAARKPSYILSRYLQRKEFLSSFASDLVVIEHQLFPFAPLAWEQRYLPSRYLLEFDDAIYVKHPRKMPWLIRHATAVIAGNRTLAEYARQFHKEVHIVPTVLDTALYAPGVKSKSDRVQVGWAGLEYNFEYLRFLTPVFQSLTKSLPVDVVILSGSRPRGFEFPFRFEKWDPGREAQQINEFDIGVMPLRDDVWGRGKCGMKLLQFMSLGVPAVASPVGVNQEIVEDGVNGFLARSAEEWEQRLARLVADADLRRRMGAAARNRVVQDYS